MKVKKVERIDHSDTWGLKLEYFIILQNRKELSYTQKSDWDVSVPVEQPANITKPELQMLRDVFKEEILLEFTEETILEVD